MHALILAAGSGSRMAGYEGEKPKCLYEVAGKPLITRQLEALSEAGIESVTVVVGFQSDRVRSTVGEGATFVENERYGSSNSLYSFALGAEHIDDDALVLNSDVLFAPETIELLLAQATSAFAYDSTAGDDQEAMKVSLRDGRLHFMSKQASRGETDGENLGVILFERAAFRATAAAARDLMSQGRHRDWLASAVNAVAGSHHFQPVDVAKHDLPWIEIDFPLDLERARAAVWPAILGRRSTDIGAPSAASGSLHRAVSRAAE